MSKSSLTFHNLGAIHLSSDLIVNVINVTSSSYTIPAVESGNIITCSGYTAGTAVITLPKTTGAQYTVVQKSASNPFSIFAPLPIYGTLVCAGTGGNVSVTGGQTVTFTTNSKIGDSLKLNCDGSKYFINGVFSTIGSLTSTA
jgi:hypothetical protein